MERCVVCHTEFEPIELPIELPQEIWGTKLSTVIPPVCPACFLSGVGELIRVAADIIRIQQEQEK